MKSRLLILLGCLWAFSASSQDVITLRNGDELTGKITEVGISEIRYKKSETSPVYVIEKDKVFMIKYEDGTKDVFDQSKSEETKDNSTESVHDICQQGTNDASLNYDPRGASGGVIAATIFFSPVGLLIAIGTSSTPPYKNLNAPDTKLFNNSNYKACYISEAHRMKRRKVWGAFGGGIVVNLFVAIIILSTY